MKHKIRALIIDDEPDGRELLQVMITSYCPEIEVVEICDSAVNGIRAIREHRPDLVFLDIEMPVMNAFTLLETLGPIGFELIFVTSYEQHALKAFRYKALDYLLKPIDEKELISAVDRCLEVLGKKHSEKGKGDDGNRQAAKQLLLPVRDGYIFVEISDIMRCEADGNYTRIFMEDGTRYVASKTLKDIETNLSGFQFARIHKSHLVNLNYIKRYIRGEGGTVVMSDNAEIEVSRRNKDAFLALFNL